MISKYKELEYKTCVLCDVNSISGAVGFYKSAIASDIKPVIGCELSLRGQSETVKIFSRNLKGMTALNKAVSRCNRHLPLGIDLKDLQELSDDLIVIGARQYKNKFSTFFSTNDVVNYDCRYLTPQEHIEFQVVQAIAAKSTLSKCSQRGHPLCDLFTKNKYYVWSKEEIGKTFSREQIKNTQKLLDMVEEFNFLRSPQLPKFAAPNGMKSDDYLLRRCIEGAKLKLAGKSDEDKQKYWERLKYELATFKEANLSDYMLIIMDIIDFCRKNNWLVGCGRGSSNGSLVSYLTGITQIDPIEYDLIFERFYSSARKGSLPDIDVDLQSRKREKVLEYVRNKYGNDKVCHIVTFGTLQGKGAIKDVFGAFGDVGFSLINKMTKGIPDKAKISDELAEREDKSVVSYILENEPELLREWVELKNGNLIGEYADRFEIAIKVENTKRNQGMHAGGIIISTEPLENQMGMLYLDKDEQISGYEMNECEDVGLMKVDLLAIKTVDILQEIQLDILRGLNRAN